MPRVLCIWLPNWPTQQGTPLPPTASSPRCHTSPRREQGSTTHQPALKNDTPALRQLANLCAQTFTPKIALETLDRHPWAGQDYRQPQSLFGELTGVAHLFGGELAMLRQVQQWFHQRGYQVRLALAGNPGAAWGLAHYRAQAEAPCWIATGREQAGLASLPTAALRLPVPIVETLLRLGIDSIEKLLRLPRDGLRQRFDPILLQRIDQALGVLHEPLVFQPLEPSPLAHANLDCPTAHREVIHRGVQTLLGEVCRILQQSQQGALRLECRFGMEDHAQPEVIELSLFAPTADAEYLYSLLSEALNQRSFPGAVTRITIEAIFVGLLVHRQRNLFDQGAREGAGGTALARLIDQCARRIGCNQVLGVQLRADHQPEYAYELYPLTGNGPRLSKAANASLGKPMTLDHLRRPLELLPSPQAIQVIESLLPKSTPAQPSSRALSSPPLRLLWQGKWREVMRSWGPERIETGWWRGQSIRRDYFRIETIEGAWLWLFRDLRGGRWFLHGFF